MTTRSAKISRGILYKRSFILTLISMGVILSIAKNLNPKGIPNTNKLMQESPLIS